ncbi:MAG: RNHCP domain-containing protein [Candidatus Pacebacteria bacterium]|nr:RNHCP domain-containing protein [Candidatus Paceibacterota bacterium]
MSFIRRKEDFTCEHCGARVQGSGYTNHCPNCLWSKHVDIDPGDRAATCGGMMEPIALEGSTPHYRIVHRCMRCGLVRRVNVSATDSVETLLALSTKGGIIDT